MSQYSKSLGDMLHGRRSFLARGIFENGVGFR
jgi:hypothetical protein